MSLLAFHGYIGYIPLTNRVQSLYRKLRTEFFLFDLWPQREAREPKIVGEKRGSVTCSTDREDEVSKMFRISLLSDCVSDEFGNDFYPRGTTSNF